MNNLAKYISNGPKTPQALEVAHSDYNDINNKNKYTCRLDNVYIKTLIANAPCPKTKNENSTSAAILIQLNLLGFILPGDATFRTLAAININLKKWKKTYSLPLTYAMSVPHHGSLRTIQHKTRGNRIGLDELKEFIDLTTPYSTFASAGIINKDRHPSLVILEAASYYVGKYGFPSPHEIVAYDGDWKVLTEINENKYTTLRNIDPPIKCADWIFDIHDPFKLETTARFFESGQRTLGHLEEPIFGTVWAAKWGARAELWGHFGLNSVVFGPLRPPLWPCGRHAGAVRPSHQTRRRML